MIVEFGDFVAAASNGRYDVCIAGGGVAGITLAIYLARKGTSVLLLEAGGLEPEAESQEIYDGTIVGRDYFGLDVCRLRFLGGTSNHWGGMCYPLDEIDFHERDYAAWSGWPIEKADLQPYAAEACRVLGVTPWRDEGSVLGGSDGHLRKISFQSATVDGQWTNFKDVYLNELTNSPNITVALHANVTDIALTDDLSAVKGLTVNQLRRDQPSQMVSATKFVVCFGGIENARFLLNCDSQVKSGIGNQRDLVGRFFMEHHHLDVGVAVLSMAGAGWRKGLHNFYDAAYLSPTEKFVKSKRVMNCGLRVQSGFLATNAIVELKQELKIFACSNDWLTGVFCPSDLAEINAVVLRAAWEQAPNPESRVTLGADRDQFGKRRTVLDWRVGDLDRRTIRENAVEFGRFLAQSEFGRLRLADWVLDPDQPMPGLGEGEETAGNHHMGTTRMAATAERGVVDSNSKVFGLDNLYIGGSSVFPTCGHANPTFTIVQTVLRLADHLAAGK